MNQTDNNTIKYRFVHWLNNKTLFSSFYLFINYNLCAFICLKKEGMVHIYSSHADGKVSCSFDELCNAITMTTTHSNSAFYCRLCTKNPET